MNIKQALDYTIAIVVGVLAVFAGFSFVAFIIDVIKYLFGI
jgi:hypothetical protein